VVAPWAATVRLLRDYSTAAELSPTASEVELAPNRDRKTRQPIGYGHFARAADAIRFAIAGGQPDGKKVPNAYFSTPYCALRLRPHSKTRMRVTVRPRAAQTKRRGTEDSAFYIGSADAVGRHKTLDILNCVRRGCH
jgi:hypothetical protein